jgi:hypothetical protein
VTDGRIKGKGESVTLQLAMKDGDPTAWGTSFKDDWDKWDANIWPVIDKGPGAVTKRAAKKPSAGPAHAKKVSGGGARAKLKS